MFAEADYDTTQQALDQNQNRYKGDENLFVRFYIHAHPNQIKTREAGRPIYEDREYVQIIQPGNKENIVIRPARDMDKQRFPKQYAAFKNKEGDYVEGTPLNMWPAMSPSQIEELKYYHIHTVEQIANLSDEKCQGMMGMVTLKNRARAYLEAAGISAEGEKLSARLDAMENENKLLKKQLEAVTAKLEEFEEVDE